MNNLTSLHVTSVKLTRSARMAGMVALCSLGVMEAASAQLLAPPVPISLTGVVRDFLPGHPDFDILSAGEMGQYAKSVAPTLGPDGAPLYAGTGMQVTKQWTDKDGNPIMPYGDKGLFGGHFDVDVYDTPNSTKKIYHEHQYDDKFNVTYVDLVSDSRLMLNTIIGSAYPNLIRLTLMNPSNGGGGAFRFAAGGPVQTGMTAKGFTATFDPAQLTEFRIDFVSLADMRATKPDNSQGDPANRDGALSIRMYDVTTNSLVYELAVYHHIDKKNQGAKPAPQPAAGTDSCGVPLNDTVGTFGAAGAGAVTDSSTFQKWFGDDPLVNASSAHSIMLVPNAQGVFEYTTNAFYPIDGQLFGNSGASHNNFFTFNISSTFIYHACSNMFFEFQGNDDAWVYVNGELVIDLGGVATGTRQYVAMDRLNLVDGQEYTLDFFSAHRRQAPESIFNMRTNIQLKTNAPKLLTSSLYD